MQLLQPLDTIIFLPARMVRGYARIVNVPHTAKAGGVATRACHSAGAGPQRQEQEQEEEAPQGPQLPARRSAGAGALVANPKGNIKEGNEIRAAVAAEVVEVEHEEGEPGGGDANRFAAECNRNFCSPAVLGNCESCGWCDGDTYQLLYGRYPGCVREL